MNAEAAMSRDAFAEVLENAGNWETIDGLLEMLDGADFWDEDFIASAERNAKASYIRRTIKTLKDDSSFPVWASVETVNENGDVVRVYKQETLFDVEDYRKVVSYHADRSNHHRTMATSYARRCNTRFGQQLPLPM